jgi:CRISPR-associated protein Cas1
VPTLGNRSTARRRVGFQMRGRSAQPMPRDLHLLPKVRDSWSFLYIEHCRVDREDSAIVIHDAQGRVSVPCATLSLLMLGPGTSLTHAAILVLAEAGCLVAWVGEQGIRFYAQGMGETRSATALLRQVELWSDPTAHLAVVVRMYQHRFEDPLDPTLTLRQIRGKEGARVRAAYARLAREYGVEWTGRSYDRAAWNRSDPLNRALSTANSCLYGVCHAAIVSLGLSPALGFVHTGKQLSFVYDVADLYKMETSVPVAFKSAAQSEPGLESRVRHAMRDLFAEEDLLAQVVKDLQSLMRIPDDDSALDTETSRPGALWDPEGLVASGVNHEDDEP